MCEPPAGVEGQAKAMHRLPPQEGFKSKLRGHHIHRHRLLQQACGVPSARLNHDPLVGQLGRAEVTQLAARSDIGVRLDNHCVVWIIGQCGRKHRAEAGW